MTKCLDNEGGKFLVGWREWAKLPELGIPIIKVKIDTGARTSALHAFDVEHVKISGKDYVNFTIHPLQRNDRIVRSCCAEIIDFRNIKSSNGHTEERFVIRTTIAISEKQWQINITLTNRDIMKHRMLLGREAMRDIIVDPTHAYHQGSVSAKEAKLYYDILRTNESNDIK